MNAKGLKVTVLLTSLLLSFSAFAAIPPSFFMVEKLTAMHTSIKTVLVKTQVDVGGQVFTDQTFVDLEKGVLVSRATAEGGQELGAWKASLRPQRREPLSVVRYLLFTQDPNELADFLVQAGLPIVLPAQANALATPLERQRLESTHLSRIDRSLFWVIGKKGQSSDPMLWFYKDLFLPSRFDAKGGGRFLFGAYQFSEGFGYPREVHFFEGVSTDSPTPAAPTFTAKTLELVGNASMPQVLNSVSSSGQSTVENTKAAAFYRQLR